MKPPHYTLLFLAALTLTAAQTFNSCIATQRSPTSYHFNLTYIPPPRFIDICPRWKAIVYCTSSWYGITITFIECIPRNIFGYTVLSAAYDDVKQDVVIGTSLGAQSSAFGLAVRAVVGRPGVEGFVDTKCTELVEG